jgi:hypothetical protein
MFFPIGNGASALVVACPLMSNGELQRLFSRCLSCLPLYEAFDLDCRGGRGAGVCSSWGLSFDYEYESIDTSMPLE